ncbi:MAG: tetraacyldisaccharide 4'-kinase [Planctomycetota bacterium]
MGTTSDKAPRPREAPLPGWLAVPMARVYALELARRNRRFDRGRGVVRLDCPVISVGNLSVGGVGKTPMVSRILHWLRGVGEKPCVAMRGYKAQGGLSDEAELHRRQFPDEPTPVVAQADRVEGLYELFDSDEGHDVNVVVLDDGFQHRRIWRDLDIVLLDATRPLSDIRLLPAGYWREPASALARADAVVITHAELADDDAIETMSAEVEKHHGERPIAVARHEWRHLRRPTKDGVKRMDVAWLTGKTVVGLCAIGRPEGFEAQLERRAGEVARLFALPDHHPLDERTLRGVGAVATKLGAEAIVVSEKDWVKIEPHAAALGETPIAISELSLRFDEGSTRLERKVIGLMREHEQRD